MSTLNFQAAKLAKRFGLFCAAESLGDFRYTGKGEIFGLTKHDLCTISRRQSESQTKNDPNFSLPAVICWRPSDAAPAPLALDKTAAAI
ncbi:MAG: hypothetical protein GTO53_13025 [Planctomycetales bacterium]|nr:hypothetical protein [Planctomycetales bacterium]NIM10021.1 hypothetical protein [Planctomycetales bacterium]NIN09462.1 hypothetical protein [Planctomycetales bacterium]NIN78570.1 hypothetical protein [Planctomycetales bacterium]NIO35762.1 hypothetical protein [Planctomycetales bacterium]